MAMKPTAAPPPAAAEGGDPLGDVEASAWQDIKAAIESGDDAAGVAALRDFFDACFKRREQGEYAEE